MKHGSREAAEAAPTRRVGNEYPQSEHDFLISNSGLGTRLRSTGC